MVNQEDVSVCAGCKRIAKVQLSEYIEPHRNPDGSDKDLCGHVIAAICDDCVVTHWAWKKVTLDSVAEEACEWGDKQFGGAYEQVPATVAHLRKEVEELSENPYDSEEQADCFLLICHTAHRARTPLAVVAYKKLQKNKTRKWGEPNEDGVIEHIRDDQA